MKKLHNQKTFSLLLGLIIYVSVQAQEAAKPELMVNLGYFTVNNTVQYIQVKTQLKADNKLQPLNDVTLLVYLDSVAEENLIGKLRTNEKGIAKAGLPVHLKDKWNATATHKFFAITAATKKLEETVTELDVRPAKISIDTSNIDGTRTVNVLVSAFENGEWIPAKEVEVKIGVSRLGGQLRIGEEESYTTDSLGQVAAEFQLDSLPADDVKNNIVLVAKIEDNDLFGNLSINKKVAWGSFYKRESNFGKRTLYATRTHTPIWLLFMAYSIIALVWGVIIYLIVQLVAIRKLGKQTPGKPDKTILSPEVFAIK